MTLPYIPVKTWLQSKLMAFGSMVKKCQIFYLKWSNLEVLQLLFGVLHNISHPKQLGTVSQVIWNLSHPFHNKSAQYSEVLHTSDRYGSTPSHTVHVLSQQTASAKIKAMGPVGTKKSKAARNLLEAIIMMHWQQQTHGDESHCITSENLCPFFFFLVENYLLTLHLLADTMETDCVANDQ